MSDTQPALVFIGFMGAGKSKAARAAAAAEDRDAVDTDSLLEVELGMPIAEFFEHHGEDEFRRREAELVCRVLERAGGDVVALGGGSVLSERVREALAGHLVVWLELEPDEAWARVESSERPLTADRARFDELLAQRTPLYEGLADAIVPGLRDVVARALPAIEALRGLPAGAKLAWAASASGEYPVFVADGLLDASPLAATSGHGATGLAGRSFCVTDANVGALYADRLRPLETSVEVPAGEPAKTLAEAERVLRALADAGMTRSDHLLALGGGVVGDLAGFCAAVYQRGVEVVQVPTTLVAQVDSAYGGKTGVDLPEAKNYVGSYHLPAAVLTDPQTLRTLPPAELAAGFAEVLKTALIAGGGLWERVRSLEAVNPDGIGEIVFDCARTKLAIVAADERDAGRRAALNLGHTVGHAIEAASGYSRYRHGEAVGLGLLAALELSDAAELRAEVEELLAEAGLATRLDPTISIDDLVTALGRDKKRTAGGVGFVLCRAPGEVVTGQLVDPDRVRAAVEALVGSGG